MSQTGRKFTVKRLAFNAILIAVFAVLSRFSVTVAGLKFTFTALPGIIAAVLFSPADAFIVAGLGAFIEQMTGPYGFTATTLLWIIPPAMQALTAGLLVRKFRTQITPENIVKNHKPWAYILACMAAALVASILNTGVFYVDSKLYGYYNFALIFGVFWIRIIKEQIIAVVISIIAAPVIYGLSKANIRLERKEARA